MYINDKIIHLAEPGMKIRKAGGQYERYTKDRKTDKDLWKMHSRKSGERNSAPGRHIRADWEERRRKNYFHAYGVGVCLTG